MQEWKSKTCEDCIFRVKKECRFSPPSVNGPRGIELTTIRIDHFPDVFDIGRLDGDHYFQHACSKWSLIGGEK